MTKFSNNYLSSKKELISKTPKTKKLIKYNTNKNNQGKKKNDKAIEVKGRCIELVYESDATPQTPKLESTSKSTCRIDSKAQPDTLNNENYQVLQKENKKLKKDVES